MCEYVNEDWGEPVVYPVVGRDQVVKAVQKLLGHASAVMTLDVYADLFDDDLDAVGEALSLTGDSKSVGRMCANRGHDDSTVTEVFRKSQ